MHFQDISSVENFVRSEFSFSKWNTSVSERKFLVNLTVSEANKSRKTRGYRRLPTDTSLSVLFKILNLLIVVDIDVPKSMPPRRCEKSY